MDKKKLSTKDILAQARAQAAAKAAGEEPASAAAAESPAAADPAPEAAAPEVASAAAPAESAPAKPAPAAPPSGAPKSTKDILATARAQAALKAGGGAAPEAAAAKPAAPKPAAPAGGAKSTKDILAAARAQAAGETAEAAAPAQVAPASGAAESAAKPAKPGKAATKAAGAGPAAAAGATPSVQEMLKAVRAGQPAEPAVVTKAPVAPKIPQRPAAKPGGAKPAAKKDDSGSRRGFLLAILAAPFALAWTLLTVTGVIAVLGAARFMFPNILVEPPSKFKVGPPDDYPGGTVSNKWKAQFGIWIVHAEYQGRSLIYALSTVCTHLGCTPNWLEGEQKFKCPCHGSGFYITGINFEGPAPRPLERFAITKAEDGMLEIDKSSKFQQEMGQWDDPKSYVELV
jgi:cytochrome b6-f complex iron-sulfur subunit